MQPNYDQPCDVLTHDLETTPKPGCHKSITQPSAYDFEGSRRCHSQQYRFEHLYACTLNGMHQRLGIGEGFRLTALLFTRVVDEGVGEVASETRRDIHLQPSWQSDAGQATRLSLFTYWIQQLRGIT